MVRKYKPKPGHRKYTKYDPELMKKAYEEYAEGHDSIRNIARKYNITKSCLYGRLKLNRTNGIGGRKAFTLEREEHIIKYIHACAPWQYHLQIWDLRLLIKLYLDRRPVITKRKFDNNLPGQDFVASFVKRNEDNISQKVIQSLNDDGAITSEAVLSYFHEMRMLNADLDPGNIVCYNDIIITDDNEENNKKKTGDTPINDIFVMLASSASGEMLEPYILYKEKQCYERGSRRSLLNKQSHQARKRLNANIFEDWFKTVILPFYKDKTSKKYLIGGYFSSRITLDLVEICKEYNIHFIFLPDKSGNLTHPLYSLSQLIFPAWTIIVHQRITEGLKPTIVKERFYEIIKNITNNGKDKALEGFKKTGINPLNPVEVLTQLPDYNETAIEDVDEDFEKDDADVYIIQVKKEMEWDEEVLDDDSDNEFDEDMINIENKVAKEREENSKVDSRDRRADDQMTFQDFDIKLSPAEYQEDTCEDSSVFMPETILEDDDATQRSSRGRILKPKHKEKSSEPEDRDVIYYVPALKERATAGNLAKKAVQKKKTQISNNENDPLSSSQGAVTLNTSETYDEETAESSRCENVGCHTQTRLLQAILSSVTRQEKLQERTTRAVEAQAQALANIARLLERQAPNT